MVALMLSLPLSKSLSVASVAAGSLGMAVADVVTGGPVQLVLASSSLLSICLGFYWYGRLTERVQSEQELRKALEVRVLKLEDTSTDPGAIAKMALDVERLSRVSWKIAAKLEIDDDRSIHD